MNSEFENTVLSSLGELKTGMKSLIGNGQPGRVGVLEDKTDEHAKKINQIIGGLILASALSGLAAIAELLLHWGKH